jgi:hypothetical protein
VSSPSRYASDGDPLGACVVTVLDDGVRAAITVCGSGIAGSQAGAEAVLDELLGRVATLATLTGTASVSSTSTLR